MSGYVTMAIIVIVLSLLAHSSRNLPKPDGGILDKYQLALRFIYGFMALNFCAMGVGPVLSSKTPPLMCVASVIGTACSFAILFKPVREFVSPVLTVINQIAIGRPLLALIGKLHKETLRPEVGCGEDPLPVTTRTPVGVMESLMVERIFLPQSIPHLNGLWCYLIILAECLGEVRPDGLNVPTLIHLPTVNPIPEDVVGMLCGLLMAAFGAGMIVSRKFPFEIMRRLGLVKPRFSHVAIALGLVVFTFVYDWIWSIYTHAPMAGSTYAGVMTKFNEGSYLRGGGSGDAFVQALTTGLTAGLEEEILFRGALQPVLGVVPSALLHAAMHQQFSGAPLYMLQIFIWSSLMGVVKRYTNTTTTVIAHATFNFMQVFLIGFNP